jgi:hypothetical protein
LAKPVLSEAEGYAAAFFTPRARSNRLRPVHIATRACDSGIITTQERDRILVALEQ